MLNEKKGPKMRMFLAVSACLLAVGSWAADPHGESLSAAGKPDEKISGDKALEQLRRDRDNLFIQVKYLLEKNRGLAAVKNEFDKSEEEKRALRNIKENMERELMVLNEEIEEEKKRSGQALREARDLSQIRQEMERHIQRLEELLAAAKSESGITNMEDVIARLNVDKEELNSKIAKIRGDLAQLMEGLKKERAEFASRLKKNRIKSEKDIAKSRNRLEKMQKKYAVEVKEKKSLGRELARLPKKMAGAAEVSSRMVRGAANRHYNAGVFYTKKSEYRRALAEFEEAVRIKPDHAYALYNIGHLYSTHMVNREKAVRYFSEYLRVSPSAKDRDLVRRYILAWKPRDLKKAKSRWNVLGRVLGG